MRTSDQINEIAKAMSQMQGKMKPAVKSSKNPFFKSNYSDISSVWNSVRTPLAEAELTVWQDAVTTEIGVSVTTRIVHSSGQWCEFGPLEMPIAKRDAQAVGSSISYAKRYALSAALGVVSAEEDDDAEQAVARPIKQEVVKAAPPVMTIISKDQADVLSAILVECSEEYNQKITKFLSSQNMDSVSQLSEMTYRKILETAQKESLKNMKVAYG